MGGIRLREADKLEVVVLVDNYSDQLLEDSDIAKRLRAPSPDATMAEPGLSLLIKVFKGDETHTVLMDAGITGTCFQHNVDLLAGSEAVMRGAITADVRDVELVVLSHGHSDHFGGLINFLNRVGEKVPLVCHPSAFVERRSRNGFGSYSDMVSLDKLALKRAGAVLSERCDPSTAASDLILVSGEVERTTGFEKGAPSLEANIGENWMPDPFCDDQALAVHIKNHGLVVLAGCGHAGIINIVKHLCKITGTNKIHAVMGGFHLPGPDRTVAECTIAEMKRSHQILLFPCIVRGGTPLTVFLLKCLGSSFSTAWGRHICFR